MWNGVATSDFVVPPAAARTRTSGPSPEDAWTWVTTPERTARVPAAPITVDPTDSVSIGTPPSGVRIIVPAGRHWSVSPTTVTFWWPPARRRTISFWARLVS